MFPSHDRTGESMMDRTITIPGIGECVWCTGLHKDTGHLAINIHLKDDVLNNKSSLLAYNYFPYISAGKQPTVIEEADLTMTGGVGRIIFKDNDEGMVWLSAFFVHPNWQGKGLAKEIFKAGIAMIGEAIGMFSTIVLNAKEHPTSPVPTNVIHNWYKKSFGAVTFDDVCDYHKVYRCSHRKSYTQYPIKTQRVVRKNGGNILLIGKFTHDPDIVAKIHNNFNVAEICSEWS